VTGHTKVSDFTVTDDTKSVMLGATENKIFSDFRVTEHTKVSDVTVIEHTKVSYVRSDSVQKIQ
jgi:hypothetical protein